MPPSTPLPTEGRSAILERQIAKYIKRGYRVTARTPTTAQLVKPKRFGCGWLLLCCISLGIAIIFYLRASDDAVYLEVEPTGRVRKR